MKKFLAVAAAFLLVASLGAAMNKGELIDRIADDADLEKKVAGQPTYDDLEMERGVKPGATLIWATGEGDAGKHLAAIIIDWDDGLDEEAIYVAPGEGVNTIDPETVDDIDTGSSAAADKHGPHRTGKFIVEFDDDKVAGWKTVTIPSVSIEEGTYREGNDAKQEKEVAGQPSFDDLEMERGVKIGDKMLADGTGDNTPNKVVRARVLRTDGAPSGLTAGIVHPESETLRANGRKTVRPEDLIAVATDCGGPDCGDEVRAWIKEYSPPELDASDVTYDRPDIPPSGTTEKRSARKGRNPQTGKEIKIPAKMAGGDEQERGITIATAAIGEGMEGLFVVRHGKVDGSRREIAVALIDEIRDEDDVAAWIKEYSPLELDASATGGGQAEKIGTVGEAIEYIEKNAKD